VTFNYLWHNFGYSEFQENMDKVGINQCNFSNDSFIYSIITVPKYMKFTYVYIW